MTVKELIEKLQEFPDERDVSADTQDWAAYSVWYVEKVERKTPEWEKISWVHLS